MNEALKTELTKISGSASFRKARENAMGSKNPSDRLNHLSAYMKNILEDSSLCVMGRTFYYFDGCSYLEIGRDELNTLLYNFMCDTGVMPSDVVRVLPHCFFKIQDKPFRPQANLIAFENCILNVDNMRTFSFSDKLHVNYKVNYSYDPQAECPMWEKFLNRVLPDKTKQAVLQEFIGMIYLDRTRVSVEKALFLLGKGANGKSVIARVIKGIVGPGAVCSFTPQQLTYSEYAVAETEGKRLNYCEEIDSRGEVTDKMKAIISSEPIQARRPYGEYISVRPPAMIFNLNELPPMPDRSYGFWRRQLIVRFEVTIPERERDKMLSEKMKEEYPGIFRWAMDGLARLKSQNYEFSSSKDVDDAIETARAENNPVLAFMREYGYMPEPLFPGQEIEKMRASDLAAKFYNEYLGIDGVPPKVDIVRMGKELSRLGYRKIKSNQIFYEIFMDSVKNTKNG